MRDKEKANFCDFFQPRPDAFTAVDDSEARKAKADLEALFGVDSAKPASEEASQNAAAAESNASREQLERMFGLGDDSKK